MIVDVLEPQTRFLRLVMPSRLSASVALRRLVAAITATQRSLVRTAEQLRAAQSGDEVAERAAIRADVMSDVAARLSENVTSAFDVWDQNRAQICDEPPIVDRAAVPPMSLPDPTPDTAPRLIHALLMTRAKLGALALNLAAEADDLREPYQGERAAGARFLAVALDELDAALAVGLDAEREHAAHEQQHGRWIDRTA